MKKLSGLGQSRSLYQPGLRPREHGADGHGARPRPRPARRSRTTSARSAQGGGKPVDNAVDGIKAIAAGEKVDYAGASGPCDFDDKGDILDCKFRYEQIKAGKLALVKIA